MNYKEGITVRKEFLGFVYRERRWQKMGQNNINGIKMGWELAEQQNECNITQYFLSKAKHKATGVIMEQRILMQKEGWNFLPPLSCAPPQTHKGIKIINVQFGLFLALKRCPIDMNQPSDIDFSYYKCSFKTSRNTNTTPSFYSEAQSSIPTKHKIISGLREE